MANSNGWGDGAANNSIGWGQGANNAISWGDLHAKSWAGATDIVGLTTDPAASAYFSATGITGATQQQAIDNLVKGLKQDGLWSKMKAVYPFVTDNRNLLSYTNAFGNGYYQTDSTSTFTPNNTIAPDGTNTATRFTAVTPNNNYFYSANTNLGQNFGTGNKTLSIYVKAGTFSGNVAASITSDGSTQSTVVTLTNNWQRITVSKNVIVAGGTPQYYIDLGALSMTAGQYFYIWGIQLETSSTATTYQPIATTQQAFIANQFKYNLVNPVDSDAAFRLVFNGGWTHSANGATPNGTNGYADTKLNGTQLNVNSQTLSYYSRTNSYVVAGIDIGIISTHRNALSLLRQFGGVPNTSVSDISDSSAIAAAQTTSINNSSGYFIASRTNATMNKLYRTGISVANNTANWGVSSALALPFFIGGSNSSGTASGFTNRQCAFASIGDGLTDTEAANLYTRVQAFQTALSRQV